jgi:hypothetical protein
MTDEPLVRPRLLSQLAARRTLSLIPRGYSLVGGVQRQHRSLGSYRPRMALVQRMPLVRWAQVSRREAGWRPVRMIWFGRSTPFEPTVDQVSPLTPSLASGPGAAPAVARQPIAAPGSLPSRPPAERVQRPRVAAQPASRSAPRPAPIPDRQPAPPAAPAPQRGGGLVRGSDLWQRLFPERPSLRQTIRDTDVSRQAETARRLPPPVIPSRLPRTRTWEVKSGQAVPLAPSAALREETVSLDVEEGAETPEPESDASTAARARAEPDSGQAATIPHVQREPASERPGRRTRASRRPRPPAVAETPASAETVGIQRDETPPVVEGHREIPTELEPVAPEVAQASSPAEVPLVSRQVEGAGSAPAEPPPVEPSAAPAEVQAKAAEAEAVKPEQVQPATPGEASRRPERAPGVRRAAVPPEVQTVKAEPPAEKPRRIRASALEAPGPAAAELPPDLSPTEAEPAQPVSPERPAIRRETAEPPITPAEGRPAAPDAPAAEVPVVQPGVRRSDIQVEAVQPSPEEVETPTRPSRTAERAARAPEEPATAGPAAPHPEKPPRVQRAAPGPVETLTVGPAAAVPDVQAQDVLERARPAEREGVEVELAQEPAAGPPEVQLTAEPETVVSPELEPEAAAEPQSAVERPARRVRETKPSARSAVSREAEAEPTVEMPTQPAEPPVEAGGAETPRPRAAPAVSRQAEEPVTAEPVATRGAEGELVRAERPGAQPSPPRVTVVESPPIAAAGRETMSPRVRAEPRPEEVLPAEPRGTAPRVQAMAGPETPAALEGEAHPMRVQAEGPPAVSRQAERPDDGGAQPPVTQLWHPSFSGFSPSPVPQGIGRPAVDRGAELAVARGASPDVDQVRPVARAAAGPARLPLHVPVIPIAAVQRVEGETPAPSSETSATTEPGEAEPEGQPEVDKELLAHEVYEMLKQRMIVEREQFWGF